MRVGVCHQTSLSGAETPHLNPQLKAREADFDICLLSSAVGVKENA